MNKAEKVQKIYEWLLEVYERTQEPISPHKAKFGELSTKYGIRSTYLVVAKENFFDKTLLASTNSGSYLWTSIRPNIKMAVRVIEEGSVREKEYRDAYKKKKSMVKTKKPIVLATTTESIFIPKPKKDTVSLSKSGDKYIRIAINVTKIKRYSFRLAEFVGAIGAYELIKYFINK